MRSVNGREGEVPGTSGELSEYSRSANDLHLILRLWDAKMLELDLVLRCAGEILISDHFLVTLSSIWSWNYFRGPVTTVLEFLPSLHIGSNGDPPEDHLRTCLELISGQSKSSITSKALFARMEAEMRATTGEFEAHERNSRLCP